jgi:RNA-directed DNA polymerase
VHRLSPPAHGRPAPGQRRCAEEARRPRGDGATWQAYEPGLDERLSALPGRVYRRTYRAQPARRGYVPQPEGRQRLLGIAVLEDKRGQQAVVTIRNQMYEEDVRGGSSGVRPGRRPHRALSALSGALTRKRVNDGLEYDSRGCCAPLSQAWLVKLLQHRVAAPHILRLRQKGLRASVSEEGQGSEMLVGGPQGAVVSPFLGTVYRPFVFDLWGETWRQPIAHGAVVVVRYADDGVVGFATGRTPSGC